MPGKRAPDILAFGPGVLDEQAYKLQPASAGHQAIAEEAIGKNLITGSFRPLQRNDPAAGWGPQPLVGPPAYDPSIRRWF